ncbi:MAG: DUF333 domain-containing protein [Paracoccaceae bacterium]
MRSSVPVAPSSLCLAKTARRAGIGVILLLALTACGGGSPKTEMNIAPVSMANPASVYCNDLGGQLEIRAEQGGEAGYCHLPDGTTVEEWKLYRDNNPL